MIQIDDIIISREIFEKEFHCDLQTCHGNCCVFGDSGAPLEEKEVKLLEKHLPDILPWVSQKGRKALEEQGAWVIDHDGDKVTPLVDGEECAYTYFEAGIAFCGIEKAFYNKKSPLLKPVSCHLYPIRVQQVGIMTALNYHQWPICDPARILGKQKGIPVFRFVKDALIRAFGQAFYDEMEIVYEELKKL